MSIILDLPASLERERSAQAVRSHLSPDDRYAFERGQYKAEYHNRLVGDFDSKQQHALAKDNGRDRTERDAGIGMPLHSSVFIERLLKINPNLWFERSAYDAEKIGIYLQVPVSMDYLEGKRFLMGFHDGILPEFVLLKKPDGTGMTGILRQGWRTILARLLRMGVIDGLAQIEIMFGQPSCQSAYWACLTGKRSHIE